jgi:hypothetical protein
MGKVHMRRILEEGTLRDVIYNIRTPDGKEFSVETSGSKLIDSTGATIGYVTISRDVTEKVKEMKALESKDRVLEVVTSIGALLLTRGDLFKSMDVELAKLGKAVDVSRAYIFKNTKDENGDILTSQIIEWTNDGITPQKSNPDLQGFLMKNGFKRWIDVLSEGGAIVGNVDDLPEIERPVLRNQGIRSLAVVPIISNKEFWGFIGFDECSQDRKWHQEELKALKMAGSMIGSLIEINGII